MVGAALLTTAMMVKAQTRVPDLGTIVQRLEQAQAANHGNVRPYQVTRQYLFYEGQDKPTADSSVVADVSYYPPDTKQFEIVNASGSGRGQHVVKSVLEHESEMATDWHKTAITTANYNFSFLGEETLNGRPCFILSLAPRRKTKELVDGKAWIDATNYHILQVQGELAKSPSFWIKKVDLTLYFSEVEGMWLQTAVRAVADVRVFGTNILSERDLKYRVGAESVVKKPPQNPELNIATYVR
jgi:hypothetical protein